MVEKRVVSAVVISVLCGGALAAGVVQAQPRPKFPPAPPKNPPKVPLPAAPIAGPNLSNGSDPDTLADVAASGTFAHVAWVRAGREIKVASSTNSGQSFLVRATASRGGAVTSAPVVAARGQNAYVVWAEQIPGAAPPLVITTAPNSGNCTRFSRDRRGNIMEGACVAASGRVPFAPGGATRADVTAACEREIPCDGSARDLGDCHLARNVCKGLNDRACDHSGIDLYGGGTTTRNAACRAAFGECNSVSGDTANVCNEIRGVIREAIAPQPLRTEPQSTRSQVFYVATTDGGSTWSAPANVSETPGSARTPVVALSDNGNAYVAWVDTSNGVEKAWFRRIGGPASRVALENGGPDRNPHLAAAGNMVAITFEGDRGEGYKAYYGWSRDGGAAFAFNAYENRGRVVTRDNRWGEYLFNDVASDGQMLVYGHEHHDIYTNLWDAYLMRFPAFSADANTVRSEHTYYEGSRGAATPRLGRMMPAFAVSNGKYTIAYRKGAIYANGEFRADVIFQDQDRPPVVAHTGDDVSDLRVARTGDASAAVWAAPGLGGRSDVYMRRWAGGGNVSQTDGASTRPRVAAASDRFVVVWTEDVGGNSEIFFKTVPLQ